MTSTYFDGMVVYDDPSRRAGRSASIRVDSRYRSFVQSSPNSLTADWRECPRMTSKYIDGMVVYDGPSRRAGRSADIRVDPRYSNFVQEFAEQHNRRLARMLADDQHIFWAIR